MACRPGPGTSTATLRRLLVLARELLQAQDVKSVMRLAGPAIQELLVTDGTLLLVALGDEACVTEYDLRGNMRRAREGSVLLQHARQAMDDRTPILLPELAAETQTHLPGRPAEEATSLLALPFPPGEPVGVLTALWYRKGHQQQLAEQILVLRSISELIGAALGNVASRQSLERRIAARTEEIADAARAHAKALERSEHAQEELHRIAVTDVMTGLLNRRGFFHHAERSLKVARRQGTPSALIFADVDGLKRVNDGLGHEAGDRLICDCARILQASFRDSDVVARIGGDEFAAFTLEATHPEVILERIRKNIDTFRERASPPYPIAFSTGIVRCEPSSDSTLADYLAQADRQMYARKHEQCE